MVERGQEGGTKRWEGGAGSMHCKDLADMALQVAVLAGEGDRGGGEGGRGGCHNCSNSNKSIANAQCLSMTSSIFKLRCLRACCSECVRKC